jgi:hypothetical protein
MMSQATRWLLSVTLFGATAAQAATLALETKAAWDEYLRKADADLRERTRAGGSFLWSRENTESDARVRRGEIVVAPAPGQNPKRVAGGLIHHWMGAMFVPGLRLGNVLQITRDYDRYKEFYRPFVIDSKSVECNDVEDRFSIRLMNKALYLKMAVDADYHSKTVRLDERRLYSVSKSTRVQEIEEYGQPGERRIPEGEGGGYIWSLCSISRLEERDGGVYVEVEALALSRDIPAMLRLMMEPVVRRMSRNSLATALRQTEEAALGHGSGHFSGE